jgi:multiple sugar transport system ATP-binding protein
LELPFVTIDLPPDMVDLVGMREYVMVGIRPELFEDLDLLDESKIDGGVSFDAKIDVVEWLGNEQYAYIPFDAHEDLLKGLSDLARELDSEHMRSQVVVALDPATKISDGSQARIWFDPHRMHIFDAGTGENLTRQLAVAQ